MKIHVKIKVWNVKKFRISVVMVNNYKTVWNVNKQNISSHGEPLKTVWNEINRISVVIVNAYKQYGM